MTWQEIAAQKVIYLNLGGKGNCHPNAEYKNYVAVDIAASGSGWTVRHDLRYPIPLPENSVDRILAEDFLEHVTVDEIKRIILECFRLLKPGGFLRIGVPDYNNPKDRAYRTLGKDQRIPVHVTLPDFCLMKKIITDTPFQRHTFYHYWDGDVFVFHKIDYSRGMIKRTPDNDPRNKKHGFLQKVRGCIEDLFYILSKGIRFRKNEFLSREGHRLYVTSLVVDLFKD